MKPWRTILLVVLAASLCVGAGRRRNDPAELLDPARATDLAVLEALAAVEASPDDSDLRVTLGNAWRAASFTDMALDAYNEATRIDPDNGNAWNNAGVAQRSLGQRGAATSSFRRAVDVDPRNAEARYNLAHALADERDFDRAVVELKAALLLRPSLGDRIGNPKSFRSAILMPSRIALYLDTLGSTTLAPIGASALSADPSGELAPWLVSRSVSERTMTPRSGASHPESAPTPIAEPGPAPTPIVIGPSSTGTSPAGARPTPAPEGKEVGGGRRIRRGGPLPTPPR